MKAFGIELSKDIIDICKDTYVKVLDMKKEGNVITINGCIDEDDEELHHGYIIKYDTKSKKVIYEE